MAQEKVAAEPFSAALSDRWDCDPARFKSAAQVLPSPAPPIPWSSLRVASW